MLSGRVSPVLLLLILIVVIFGFAVAEPLGAPVPEANQQLLIGMLVGGLAGGAGTAFVMRNNNVVGGGESPGARPGG